MLSWQGRAAPIVRYLGPGTALLGVAASLYLTRDNGRDWQRRQTPGHGAILAIAQAGADRALVSISGEGVWRFHG